MRDAGRFLVVVLVAGLCAAVAMAEAPVAVSPGHTDQLVQVEGRCPTFNWGAVAGARSYQLVVYRLAEDESGEEAKPVVRATVPGSALGWTPALDQCLERGGRYAWSVQAVGNEESSEWSSPALFQVAAPTLAEFEEALAVVRSYLATQSGAAPGSAGAAEADSAGERDSEPSASDSPPSRAVGLTQLSVDGGVEATSFTGDGSTLTDLDPAALSSGTGAIDISGNADTATTASDLACTDCVSETELDFDPSTQTELDAHKASGDHDALYVNTTGDTMSGPLSMGSNTITEVGAPGTSFTATGGLTLSDDLEISKVLVMPHTIDSTTGVLYKTGDRFLHNFNVAGTEGFNLFLGTNTGNFTMSAGNPPAVHLASYNTGIGAEVLHFNTTGNANTATGSSALVHNTTGFRNTAIGTWSLLHNTTGSGNTASGVDALYSNTTGGSNTAYGLSALWTNTTGASNTAVGADALLYNATGEENIALGFKAGENLTSGSHNIIIGVEIDVPSATASNQLSIGNLIFATGVDGRDLTLSTGNVGIGTASPAQKLDVVGSVQATAFVGDGSGLTGVSPAAHVHDGADVATGTVVDARVDAALARDAEVFSIVTGADGTGSGLDADLLDGNEAAAFAPATGSPTYVAKAGDTMIGNLSMSGNSVTGVSEVRASSTLQLTSDGSLVVNLDDDDSGVSSTFSIETNGTGSDLLTVAESGLTSLVSSSGTGGLRVGNTNASGTAPVLELFSDALSTSVFFVTRGGQASAASFSGSGSGLTNLNASNLSSGTVATDRLSGTYAIDVNGNAVTATQLALEPANCPGGFATTGVAKTGNADGCFDVVQGSGDLMTGPLDMTENVISNIGAAGTDFTGTGGLTLADNLALADGELIVNSGDAVTIVDNTDGDTFSIDLTGSVALRAGAGSGGFSIEAQDGGTGDPGIPIVISAGDAGGTSGGNGGGITLQPGAGDGAGSEGPVGTTASRFIVDSDNAQGGYRLPALILEDSAGIPVGPVVSLQRVNLNNAFVDQPVALFQESGNYLLLKTSGSVLKVGRTLYFPLAGCGGDPIIELGGGMPVADISYAVGPGNVLYRGDGDFMSIDHASQTNAAAGDDTTCLPISGTSTPGHATTVALDFDDLFTGPFKMR